MMCDVGMMYDAWGMMYDWLLLYAVCMMHGVQCMMCDCWLIYNVLCMYVLCTMYNVWCMMYDAWGMMYYVWLII